MRNDPVWWARFMAAVQSPEYRARKSAEAVERMKRVSIGRAFMEDAGAGPEAIKSQRLCHSVGRAIQEGALDDIMRMMFYGDLTPENAQCQWLFDGEAT